MARHSKISRSPVRQCRARKVEEVMGEFKSGVLRSSSGEKVTKSSQARAIALSAARKKCGTLPGERKKLEGRKRK